jgi:hypothetical protein
MVISSGLPQGCRRGSSQGSVKEGFGTVFLLLSTVKKRTPRLWWIDQLLVLTGVCSRPIMSFFEIAEREIRSRRNGPVRKRQMTKILWRTADEKNQRGSGSDDGNNDEKGLITGTLPPGQHPLS